MWIPNVVSGVADRDCKYFPEIGILASNSDCKLCFRPSFSVESFAMIGETGLLPKGGQNAELVHHVLFHSAGDVRRALRVLLRRDDLPTFIQLHKSLRTYHYQNSDIWSPDEINGFSTALLKHDKDFFLVAGEVHV